VRNYLGRIAVLGGAVTAVLALVGAGTAGAATTAPPPIKNTTITCSYYCSSWQSVGDQVATGTQVTLAVRNGAAPATFQAPGAVIRQRTDDNGAYREDFSYTGPTCAPTTADPYGLCPVWKFLKKGWISGTSYAALNYPDAFAFELQYTPFGQSTGECVSLRAAAYQGEQVTLRPCGVNAQSLWIWDTTNGADRAGTPLINGSNRYATIPEVLTANGSNAGALTVTRESSQFGEVSDNQLWYEQDGPAA
jgi:hypothetical protein